MNKKQWLAATRPVRHTYKQLRRLRPHHVRLAVRRLGQRLHRWFEDHRGCSCSACRGELR